jgi:sulfatase maturation enzyme AslB (radical SAM superfamily)
MITKASFPVKFQAPAIELKELNSLWFLLTGFMCNLKCKHCYLSCSQTNKTKAQLTLDKVKTTLDSVKKEQLEEIYLYGGEPLLHRDINNIIRQCLKVCNVVLVTNGTLINDKKARFLRQLENDHSYELIFRVSLDHYTESKNDELRGRGNFRKTMSGIENLVNYGFNPIISAVNVWDEDETTMKEGFLKLLSKLDFQPEDINIKIIPAIKSGEFQKNFSGYSEDDIVTEEKIKKCNVELFDCASTRVVAEDGIYACPALLNDPRGKVGSNMQESAKKFYLEPNICHTCQTKNSNLFTNNWNN